MRVGSAGRYQKLLNSISSFRDMNKILSLHQKCLILFKSHDMSRLSRVNTSQFCLKGDCLIISLIGLFYYT